MASRRAPDDSVLKRVIQDSSSLRDAGQRLGLSTTCVRTHADRLQIHSKFRYGHERLPKSDNTLKAMLKDVSKRSGINRLARRLGVTATLLREEGERLGVSGARVVRSGLPDDGTLRRDLKACTSYAELARSYGVRDWTVRNQARRLGL